MPPFYNRSPWNLIIGLGGILAALIAVSAAISWWLLFLPLAVLASAYVITQAQRAYALLTAGYHSRLIRNGRLIYEERSRPFTRSLVLKLEYTEPGHCELFVPSESQWACSVPAWATGRRLEIAQRISETWRREDVHVNGRGFGASQETPSK